MEKRTPHTRLSQVKKLVNAGQVRTTPREGANKFLI